MEYEDCDEVGYPIWTLKTSDEQWVTYSDRDRNGWIESRTERRGSDQMWAKDTDGDGYFDQLRVLFDGETKDVEYSIFERVPTIKKER